MNISSAKDIVELYLQYQTDQKWIKSDNQLDDFMRWLIYHGALK